MHSNFNDELPCVLVILDTFSTYPVDVTWQVQAVHEPEVGQHNHGPLFLAQRGQAVQHVLLREVIAVLHIVNLHLRRWRP